MKESMQRDKVRYKKADGETEQIFNEHVEIRRQMWSERKI